MSLNGSIFEVVDVQDNNGQEMLNVYFYRRDSLVAEGTPEAQLLAEEFSTNVVPPVTNIQNETITHTAVRVRNLFDPTDAYEYLISVPGVYNHVDEMSTYQAINFTLAHDNPAIKKGRKAFGGFEESHAADGIVAGAGFIDNLLDVAIAILDPLPSGIIDTFFPVIVGRILDAGNYRLPEDVGEAIFGGLTSATFNPLVTTQNSRKMGVGA